jgi:hypothetical protein
MPLEEGAAAYAGSQVVVAVHPDPPEVRVAACKGVASPQDIYLTRESRSLVHTAIPRRDCAAAEALAAAFADKPLTIH